MYQPDSLTFPIQILRLTAERPLSLEQAIGLRGYYAAAFGQAPSFASFLECSRTYRYPRLQYKVLEGQGVILGLAEAAAVLALLPYPESLHLGREDLAVVDVQSIDHEGRWGLADETRTYSWLTPWLILDEAGLAKYFRLKSPPTQKYFLENLLISNLLAISKELGYHTPAQIQAEIRELKPITVEIHHAPTLGFVGAFSTNMEMPDFIGLGRSVARGFGAIIRLS